MGLLLGVLGGLAATAFSVAADDEKAENERLASKQNYEQQRKLEEQRALEANRQRRHENTTMIINGVFNLLNAALDSTSSGESSNR